MNIINSEDYTSTSQSTTGIFVCSDSQIHVKTDISCLPVYTWHVHPATQDMFVQSCMTCLTSHTWRVRSVMHDMFDQSHRTCLFSHVWHVWPVTRDVFDQSCMTVLMECRSLTYQEGAEEDEGDEVWDGKVDSTLKFEPIGRVFVTQTSAHAWQHDLLPVFSCCTPTHTTVNWLLNTSYTHLQQTEGNRYHLYTVLVLHPYPFKEVSFCHTRMTTTYE